MGDMADLGDRREVEQPAPGVSQQAPGPQELAVESRAGQTSMLPSAGLATAVGNTAFNRVMVSRLPAGPITVSREVSGGDKETLRDLENRLGRVRQSASDRGASILKTSDTCIGHLREAKAHVSLAAKNYKTAHDTFTGILKKADAEYEFDKGVEDAVQGILVAAVVAVLLPETLATGAAMMGLRAMAGSTSARLATVGARGIAAAAKTPEVVGTAANAAAGEVAEMGAGAVVGSTVNDPGRPSESAAGAGPSTSDKFEEVFGHLDRMIDALPVLGMVGNSQKDLALAADDVAKSSLQLRAGDPIQATVAALQQHLATIEDLETKGAQGMEQVRAMENRMLSLKNQALTVKVDEPSVIEDQLWTRWVAGLAGGANEMLDNDVIQDYLGPEGKKMFDVGYMSDSDQADIVSSQQRKWLIAQGLEPGGNPSVTNSRFKAQQKLQAIRNAVVGKTGRLSDSSHIVIDGTRYDYPRNAGEFPAGTEMIALHAIIKPHMQGEIIIDQWDEDDYDVYCNPANQNTPAPAAASAPAAP